MIHLHNELYFLPPFQPFYIVASLIVFQRKEFGTDASLSFKNNGISQAAKACTWPTPCLSQLVRFMPTARCFSTAGNSVESIPQDGSVSTSGIPSRIKFKRLDKTARHIMQA